MWLTSSSIGRKFIMALTGACLVLFVTFHCVMNAIALVWPTAYNVICEFLGANWYALVASMGLALLFIIHIIWASMLTIQNRRARGNQRYSISKNAPGVEWSSKNMYVLGVVILAFLVVHLIQFWAKMQLAEIEGHEGIIPVQAGTIFIQEAFKCAWTPVVYIIGFVALWFHMNHGFWSMFQTIGWNNTIWIQRLKKVSAWWTSIVVSLFVAQALVFTVKANQDYYTTNNALRNQYVGMVLDNLGMGGNQSIEYDAFKEQATQAYSQILSLNEQQKQMIRNQSPEFDKEVEKITNMYQFLNYLEGKDINAKPELPQFNPMMMPQGMPQGEKVEVSEEEVTAEEVPAENAAAAAEADNNTVNQ